MLTALISITVIALFGVSFAYIMAVPVRSDRVYLYVSYKRNSEDCIFQIDSNRYKGKNFEVDGEFVYIDGVLVHVLPERKGVYVVSIDKEK